MHVKLQLVICNDEGHEETVTDVITLNKNNKRIEHLGPAGVFAQKVTLCVPQSKAMCELVASFANFSNIL